MGNPQTAAVLYALLEKCGVDYDLEDFGARLRIQKAIYLMKATGAKLPYDFNWYLRGPYSPDLARDLFAGAVRIAATREAAKTIKLDAKASEKLALIQAQLQVVPSGISRTHWFEALASAAFLRRHGKSDSAILAQLKREKGFGPILVQRALVSITTLGV